MGVLGEAAQMNFNGGIIFVSYLISVAGALTTLELLTRRTHIRGLYNWFLLSAAAFTMGAVAIWSMHFIGNNSMTLILGDDHYQLSYEAGYTFGSLVVSIACMFFAFTFVGITEEVKVARIIPSGVFAGLGIVCMHYMGQFAIDYFIVVYKTGYVIGAILIACIAATVALYIFFKLREQWMNQWWKRLGCAMLLAIAVCGMHYTALVGTAFYKPEYDGTVPIPKLRTPALIGIISAIIVSACIGLLYISIKAGIQNLPIYTKNTDKRLILDAVIFDPLGHLLVKTDGTLPMTEIAHNLELNETKQEFSTNHPLFLRLLETSIHKASLQFSHGIRPSGLSTTSTTDVYDTINYQFIDSCRELRNELRFSDYGDLGILSDIVVTTDTISKANIFSKSPGLFKKFSTNNTSNTMVLTNQSLVKNNMSEADFKKKQSPLSEDDEPTLRTGKKKSRKSTLWTRTKSLTEDEEAVIGSPTSAGKRSSGGTTIIGGRSSSSEASQPDDTISAHDRLSVEDSDGEDKHIFMVRKLVYEDEVTRLLSQGYRFAEPVFIAKTMAAKLRIPADHMRQYFTDMLQMADSLCALTQQDWVPSTIEPAPNPTDFKGSTQGSVYVGAFVLIDETKELNDMQILVDKSKRFAFPMVQLKMEQHIPITLEPQQVDFLNSLHGQSLFDMAHLNQQVTLKKQQRENLPFITDDFIRGIQNAVRQLLGATSYSEALYQTSKLHTAVLDLPPFALTTGPCQLIVFKSFINTPGAITAVNHTFSEPMKCLPLEAYKAMCSYITDQAANIYQASFQAQASPSFTIQQQMYSQQQQQQQQQQVVYNNDKKQFDFPMSTFREQIDSTSSEPASPTKLDAFSLPPPPRAKRNRYKTHDSISALSDGIQDKQAKKGLQILRPTPLTVLASHDRFWWIDPIVEETIHSNMH